MKAHAAEWNLDISRIGLAGGSAGACTALYLALKDGNMHGIHAVAPIIAQTSMDPQEMKAWIPNSKYGAHAFGYRNFADWLAHRADCLADIERISPAALARKTDPARAPQIFLQYGAPLKPGEIARIPRTHRSSARSSANGAPDAAFHARSTTAARRISATRSTGWRISSRNDPRSSPSP